MSHTDLLFIVSTIYLAPHMPKGFAVTLAAVAVLGIWILVLIGAMK